MYGEAAVGVELQGDDEEDRVGAVKAGVGCVRGADEEEEAGDGSEQSDFVL